MGSQDLETMIRIMPATSGWIEDIFADPAPQSVLYANSTNEVIASNRISRVLLARWIIFRTFIEVARSLYGGTLPDNIKHDWLLFQVLSLVNIFDMDPFLELINTCLVGVDLEVLNSLNMISAEQVLGPDFDPVRDRFFYVLDEVQIAGKTHLQNFSDATGTVQRPVLLPIIRRMTENSDITVIVSGTGFSLDHFDTARVSGVGTDSVDSTWIVKHTTGDFIRQDAQAPYISRYLPSSFLESPSGISLRNRAFKWLRGR